jgi:hypothetical protein
MSSVFVANQSGCFFLCSRKKFRLVENRLNEVCSRTFTVQCVFPSAVLRGDQTAPLIISLKLTLLSVSWYRLHCPRQIKCCANIALTYECKVMSICHRTQQDVFLNYQANLNATLQVVGQSFPFIASHGTYLCVNRASCVQFTLLNTNRLNSSRQFLASFSSDSMAGFPCNRMPPYPIHGIGLSHHPSYDLMGPLASNYGEFCKY